MSIPNDLPTVNDAILAYVPPSEVTEQYDLAVAATNSVVRIVGVFDALKGRDDLGVEGYELVAGCAWLICAFSWFEKAPEALVERDRCIAALATLEEPIGD